MSTKFMTGLTLTALAALGLAAAHPAAAQTLISNGFTQSTSNNQSSPYNLTTIGTTDWINYGNYNSNAVNQKGTSTTIVGLISTAAAFHAPGSGATGAINTSGYDNAVYAQWSDGTTLSSGRASSGGENADRQISLPGNGFTYTVMLPANSTDIVNTYIAGYSAKSDFQIFAGSTSLVDTTAFATGTNANNEGYFTSSFTNTSNSTQTLTYNFYETAGDGSYENVKLADVTLSSNSIPSAAPEPSQFASLGFTVLAVMGLILKARKRRSQGEAV